MSVFFVFLLLAGIALGACVGEFVGLVVLAHSRLAVYALPVGMAVGASLNLAISLLFISGMNSFSAAVRLPQSCDRANRGAAAARFSPAAGVKASASPNQ